MMNNQSMIPFVNKFDPDHEVDAVFLDPAHSADLLCVIIDYTCKKYITFIHFYDTVTSKKKILPYGKYIQRLDLTAINKYGIDKRTHILLRHCPNITSATLGHPTTIQPTTIQYLAFHCPKLQYLSIGALESYPFMLECDFSSLKSLTSIHFTTTPLSPSSFLTLPITLHLKELHLTKMESLCNNNNNNNDKDDDDTLIQFFKQHSSIDTLILSQSIKLLLYDYHHHWLPLHQLKKLYILDTNIQDQHLLSILNRKGALNLFTLENTQISSNLIQTIINGDLYHHQQNNYLLSVKEWIFI